MKLLILALCVFACISRGLEPKRDIWYSHREPPIEVVLEFQAWHPELKRSKQVRLPIEIERGMEILHPAQFISREDYEKTAANERRRGYNLPIYGLLGITTVAVRGPNMETVALAHRSHPWPVDFQLQSGDTILFLLQS